MIHALLRRWPSFRITAKDQFRNPLVFAFLFAWLFFNWRLFVIVLFGDSETSRLSAMESHMGVGRCFLFPLMASMVFAIVEPWLDLFLSNARAYPASLREQQRQTEKSIQKKQQTMVDLENQITSIQSVIESKQSTLLTTVESQTHAIATTQQEMDSLHDGDDSLLKSVAGIEDRLDAMVDQFRQQAERHSRSAEMIEQCLIAVEDMGEIQPVHWVEIANCLVDYLSKSNAGLQNIVLDSGLRSISYTHPDTGPQRVILKIFGPDSVYWMQKLCILRAYDIARENNQSHATNTGIIVVSVNQYDVRIRALLAELNEPEASDPIPLPFVRAMTVRMLNRSRWNVIDDSTRW